MMTEFNINGKETFSNWKDRLGMYFLANSVTEAERKKAVFLTVCGAEMYQLISSLVSPSLPINKTYDEMVTILLNHLNPKPNIIVERYKFNGRMRKSGESVASYIAELRRLSHTCDYHDTANDMIRDRLVFGIGDIGIQRKLLGELGLTLEKATTIAVGMETASREAATMSGHAQEVHEVDQDRGGARDQDRGGKSTFSKCFRCGDSRHRPNNCLFKDKDCFNCKQKGHISKVCTRKKVGRKTYKLEHSGGATGGREETEG